MPHEQDVWIDTKSANNDLYGRAPQASSVPSYTSSTPVPLTYYHECPTLDNRDLESDAFVIEPVVDQSRYPFVSGPSTIGAVEPSTPPPAHQRRHVERKQEERYQPYRRPAPFSRKRRRSIDRSSTQTDPAPRAGQSAMQVPISQGYLANKSLQSDIQIARPSTPDAQYTTVMRFKHGAGIRLRDGASGKFNATDVSAPGVSGISDSRMHVKPEVSHI